MAIMINPNAIQKGSITKEMLTQGARRPIILSSSTTEVDEETYQKLLSDDVDVVFKYGLYFLRLAKISRNTSGIELTFIGRNPSNPDIVDDIMVVTYNVSIAKSSPHSVSHEELVSNLGSLIVSSGYLNKTILYPVLQEIDLTGTDAQRKAKLDQFEIDWKDLTGASDLTGARFVGNYEGELLIMAYSFANDEYEGICYGSIEQMVYRYTLELGGTLHITPLFSHLEAVEILTDNSVASKQKNIDNLNAYKSNLTELGVDTNKSFQVPFREGDEATFIGTLQYSVDTNTYIGVGCASDEDTARIIRISPTGESTITNLALADSLSRILRDFGMYPELEPLPLNSEVTGKYINSDGKYVDASGWNIASIGAVSLGNTYLLNMVSSSNMVLGVALFVSRVYKRDKEGKIIGTTLTPLFSAKNTSIPASGYVLFEAMDDYDEVLVCYKPALTSQMLVARWGFKASNATQLRNLRMIVDNKTDFEGIYELLTAGYALNLVGKGIGEPQAFMSRKTGGGNITDGSAVIKEVDGVQPIVWNQLYDKTKASKNLTSNGVTMMMNDDGSYSFSGTATNLTYLNVYNGTLKVFIVGHKYFINTNVPIFTTFGRQEVRSNPFIDTATNVNSYFEVRFNSGTSTDGLKLRLQIVDLTQMFGAGNEPSTYEEYLDRISHYHIEDTYAYNAGEVVNYKGTGIKTTGRNLWDEEWDLKGVTTGTGKVGHWTNRIASKNYIKCLSGANYYIKTPTTGWYIFFYDSYYNYISETRLSSVQSEKEFTTPSNASYIKFSDDSSNYGTTYNHDICINLSDPAFNGQYEPYKSYVRDWHEVMKKYFPDGMTSLNGVKDFFNEKKAVRKWGVKVFDGTESFGRYVSESNLAILYTDILSEVRKVKVANVVSALYTTTGGSWDTMYSDKMICGYPDTGRIAFRDDIYTSTDAWKSHLAELYAAGTPLVVYYELSEPVEDIFEKPLNLTYTVINGGTETSLATENSTQFEGSIFYGKDYVGVIDELQMQNRVTQIEFENWEN